jgi:hypothetical protein
MQMKVTVGINYIFIYSFVSFIVHQFYSNTLQEILTIAVKYISHTTMYYSLKLHKYFYIIVHRGLLSCLFAHTKI